MTAATLIELLGEVDPDAPVRIIGRDGHHDIYAAYMGHDRGVYVLLSALPDEADERVAA